MKMRKLHRAFCTLDTKLEPSVDARNCLWRAFDVFLEARVFTVQDLIATVCDNLHLIGREGWDEDLEDLLGHLQDQIDYCRSNLSEVEHSVDKSRSVQDAMRHAGIEFSSPEV